MIGCKGRPAKRAKVRFADPPWNEQSSEWQTRDCEIPLAHPAREVIEAMEHLDLQPLFEQYTGVGSPPIRPDLMRRIVLIETRLGHPCPAQWFKDTCENLVLQFAGFGIRPARTTWYDFADRVAPLLDSWNATVLRVARQRGVTKAERASLDGSAVLAHNLLVVGSARPPPPKVAAAALTPVEITT